MPQITKAIFPVAGLGTRFLPATKASPKEMLPIVDKPLIQYAVEEAIKAGITELIFITGRNKRSIEDHFDKVYELESELQAQNKHELLKLVQNIIPNHATCVFIRQNQALGLGHAILCAKNIIGNDPFAVLLADEMLDGEPNALEQLIDVHANTKSSVLGLHEIDINNSKSYGMVSIDNYVQNALKLSYVVEKPLPKDAPSNLAIIGRYILTNRIFECLSLISPGTGGEIQLTDGIAKLMQQESVYGKLIEATRYDCGSKIGYLMATVNLGLKHPEVGSDFKKFLATIK